MGQVVAYLPEWYSAVPTTFTSNNPLIGSVILDMYTIRTETETGSKTTVPVVTHQSLLNWYRANMIRFGIRKTIEVASCTADLKVVRCILDSSILGHTESLGEASPSNLVTRVSMEHPNSMAENRAFDRAVMDFLALDTLVYSSSDEIRGIVEEPEQKECFTRTPPRQIPAPGPQPLSASPASNVKKPEMTKLQSAKPIPAAAAQQADVLQEIAGNPASDEDIGWLMGRTLNLYNSVFNGKNVGTLLEKMFSCQDKTERGELAKTFCKYMRLPVRNDSEKAKEIRILKYWLYSRNVLAVSKEGALYINLDQALDKPV